jgi:hypothetical protein
MLANTLYVRVVPQGKDRDFMLLAGFDSAVIQRTAAQCCSLSAPTRKSLDAAIARMKVTYSAAEVKDVTSPNVVKQLAKLFGEVVVAGATPAPSLLFNPVVL